MIKWGFEYGLGGNKSGTAEFRNRLTAANIGQCYKGTDDAGLVYEAQENGHPDSVLIYRVSTAGQQDGNDYDVPFYHLHPKDAASVHYGITTNKWPPELDQSRVFSEPINEPRAKPDPNKPNYNNMHPCDWLGEFMTEYAILANADGRKVCGPGFNAGEPGDDGKGIIDAVNQYSQLGMQRWLRYCADNPEKAALSVHEYLQDLLPYANGYPHKLGRFQAALAAADLAGIPRTFKVFITEFGWTLNTVPDWQTAEAVILPYTQLSAKFPQLEAAAIWSLRSGWGTIDNQLVQWITDNGNPFANFIIGNQYPDMTQPQATAVEFGGTLPIEEPPMTQKDIEVTITTELPGQPVQIRGWDKATGRRVKYFQYRWMYHDGTGITYTGWKTLPLPTEIADLRGIEAMPVHDFTVTKTVTVECPDEPLDPKPPPVVLTLPQGSKGVDVSYWQGSFNWDDSGAQFGIIRCSDGLTANTTTHDGNGIDRQFFANAEKLTALGIPWAIYHFLRPGNIQAQADKVLAALAVLAGDDMPPKTAVFDNGVKFPAVWIDVEDGALSNAHVQDFYNLLAAKHHTGVYTGKPIWEQVTAGAAVWWSALPLWIAAYGINDGNVPPWPDGPFLPRGWNTAVLWQYSSNPIDKNIVGPYPATAKQPDPPTPPTGKTVDFSPYLMPAPGNIGPFLVFEKASGGTIDHQVQVQNGIVYVVKRAAVGTEYEEMRISNGFIERRYDTSPADGLPYKLDDGYGWSKWMPVSMTEGQYYKRAPRVTKYDVANNCQMVADQGVSESYIYFAKYHESYELPGGVVKTAVCELHWLWSPGGTVLERYFVAPGKWYIQWGNGDALHYLNEEPQGREPLPLSPVACLT